jgi:hypothetical protein
MVGCNVKTVKKLLKFDGNYFFHISFHNFMSYYPLSYIPLPTVLSYNSGLSNTFILTHIFVKTMFLLAA